MTKKHKLHWFEAEPSKISMNEKYELYFILSPELSTEKVDEQVNQISALLESELTAINVNVDKEGIKKLSYPIKKYTTGFYVLIQFECESRPGSIANIEKKLNINDSLMRYILVNQTDYYKSLDKQNLAKEPEFTTHRDLNKGRKNKKCIVKYLGVEAIDYKDAGFLNQFTSPYAKMFSTERTGVSSKYQRKIKKAIKRARHMALMPFTPKHFE